MKKKGVWKGKHTLLSHDSHVHYCSLWWFWKRLVLGLECSESFATGMFVEANKWNKYLEMSDDIFFFVMTVYDCWLFWSVPCCHSLNFCTTTILHPEPLQSPHSHDFCAGTTRNECKLSHKDVDRIWLPHGIYKKSCSVKETHVNCGSAGLEFWWWTNLITKGRVKEIVGKRCAHRPCRLALLTVIFGFELGFV